MKLSFGEFPEDHHLISITRPFVEWTFKYIGWVILTATVKFAYQKTGNQFLFYLLFLCYLLLLAFVGACVDWFLKFQRYKVISGKKVIMIAKVEILPSTENWRSKLLRMLRKSTRIIVGILLTFLLIGASNIATDKIIEALIEFQKTK